MPRKFLSTRRVAALKKEEENSTNSHGYGYKKQKSKKQLEMEVIEQYNAIRHERNMTSMSSSNRTLFDVNLNYQYAGELFLLDKIISDEERRKMHKLCMNIIPGAQHIQVKFSKQKVFIIFQYCRLKNYHYVTFRDVVKGNHQMKNFIDQQFIFSLYDKIYSFVSPQYRQLSKWCFYEASEKNVEFGFTDKDMMSSQSNYKIYYIHFKTEGVTSFTILNHRHDIANFSSIYIQKNKNIYAEYYNLYLEFKQLIINDCQEANEWNFKGFGEVDSDNSEQQQQKIQKPYTKTLDYLRQKINDILNKDLSLYQNKLEAFTLQQAKEEQDDDFKEEDIKIVKSEYSEKNQLKNNLLDFKVKVESETQKLKAIRKKFSRDKLVKEYKKMLRRLLFAQKKLHSKLPILSYKQNIVKVLEQQRLIILQGSTGSGKSTQLPQILCEYMNAFDDEQVLPILVTQPWKLATRTLAQRVAAELGQKIHDFVDYQASANSRKVNKHSKIIFKLDRLVVEELEKDPLLSKYSCIIIDQAHERTLNIDIILGKIKNIMLWRTNFKIIITSASLDIQLFQNFFSAKSLVIPGRMYEVTEIFKSLPSIKSMKAKIHHIITARMMNVQTQQLKDKFYGHILVFCSGIEQIQETRQYLRAQLNNNAYKILALHCRLTPHQQRQAFQQTNKIKIILATSLAETSITINGIKTVIDTGLDRQMIYDADNKVYNIVQKRISKSSAIQRAGRAGRTSEGFCFRLYSQSDKDSMKANKIPQINNIALDSLILRLKILNIGNIPEFPFITYPGDQKIKQSIQSMKMIGCLDDTQHITIIGRYLAKIPVEPMIGKAIVEGIFYEEAVKQLLKDIKLSGDISDTKMNKQQLFDIAKKGIHQKIIKIISMIINSTNLFVIKQSYDNLVTTANTHTKNGSEQLGDFGYLAKIYEEFSIILQSKNKQQQLQKWAQSSNLSLKALHEAKQTYSEIRSIIKKLQINKQECKVEINGCKQKLKIICQDQQCIIACLISSFIPNLSIYSQNPQIGYTMIVKQIAVQVSRTSFVHINGIYPKWIISYNLYPNKYGQTMCKIAQEVNFEFIKKVVPQHILKQYGILQAENKNPFYSTVTTVLPTRIYRQFQQAYKNRNDQEDIKFLQEYNIVFNDDKNELKLFYASQKDNAHWQQQQTNKHKAIQNLLQSYRAQFSTLLLYQYAGTIQTSFGTGLQVKDVKVQETNYVLRIYTKNHTIRSRIIKQVSSQNKQIQIIQVNNKLKIQIYDNQNRIFLKDLINKYREQFGEQLDFKETLLDYRHKIPRYRLTLVFFTGYTQSDDSRIYLNYHQKSDQYFRNTTNKNYMYLIEAKVKMIKQQQDQLLRNITIKKSKTQTGINLFIPQRQGEFDQFQIQELLKKYLQKELLNRNFQFPWRFMVFRQPQQDICYYSVKQWEQIVVEMMEELKVPENSYTLKAKGWKYRGSKTAEQPIYTDITCHIESFDQQCLKKFHNEYGEKQNTALGIGKLHTRLQILQNAAFVRNNVFIALKEEYLSLVDKMKSKYPCLFFQVSNPAIYNQVYKVYIKVRGNSESKAIQEPITKIRELFKPIQMNIPPRYYYLFEKDNPFLRNTLTEKLESRYNFKIYFIFDKMFGILFIYSTKQLQKQAQSKIQQAMKQSKLMSETIPYKNKPLVKLYQIIKQKEQQIIANNIKKQSKDCEGRMCFYNIFYQKKQILLTADVITFQELKEKIIGLAAQQQCDGCAICSSNLVQPYKLIECGHQLCRVCLTQYVKQVSLVNYGKIQCPFKCGQFINVYDIDLILDDKELLRVCDLRISNYIEKSQDYHGCWTPDCPQIFTVNKQSKQSQFFQCQTCGIQYCYRCRCPHTNFQCTGGLNQKDLVSLGIKKCPKCGFGLQKNGGCNHMTCGKCEAHVCWKCMKYYESQEECYKHLLEVHGGFFQQGQGFNPEVLNHMWGFEDQMDDMDDQMDFIDRDFDGRDFDHSF